MRMSDTPTIRPVVLIGACSLTLLVGVLIGSSLAGGDSESGDRLERSTASALDSRENNLPEPGAGREAGTMLSTDPNASEAAARMSPEMADLNAFLQLTQMDPLSAAQEALNESNDLDRISKLALLLAEASPEVMPELADLISNTRNDYERMQQMGMLFYAWGRIDAPAAVTYSESMGGRVAGMTTAVALSSWASLDPGSARAWVDGMENPERYQRGLMMGWSENNPLQALQYLSEQSADSNIMNRWTSAEVSRNLVAQRGVMAIDDLASLPASRNRQELLERLANELGETQPAAAAARLANINDPEVLKTAVPEVAEGWAQDDPEAAVAFVTDYKENEQVYGRAMAKVIEEWAERDPYEAGQFLNEQPASPELDRSVAEYSREVAKIDPAGAMSFAVSVNDEKLRSDTIRRVARDWKRASLEEYTAWEKANPGIVPKGK